MLPARTRPCRKACCAVGGYGFLVRGSGIEAQSPTAHTPGHSGISMYSFVRIRPRSFAQGTVSRIGCGAVPAVQTRVLVGIFDPSLSSTTPFLYPRTRVFNRTSIPL